jgi:Flp pilus assembly CpaE family ATPase
LRFADPLMLVMQNTLVAIRDAKMFLDYLPAQGVPETKVELVNNRAMSDLFSVKIDELKKTLHKEHIHRIRNDYAAAVSAYDRGVPLASVAPSSKLTKDIVGLAKYLVDRSGRPIERKSGRLSKWFHGKA